MDESSSSTDPSDATAGQNLSTDEFKNEQARAHAQQQHQHHNDNSAYQQQQHDAYLQHEYDENLRIRAKLTKLQNKVKRNNNKNNKRNKRKREKDITDSSSDSQSGDDSESDDNADITRADMKSVVQDIRNMRRRKDDGWNINSLQEVSKFFDLIQTAIDLNIPPKKISSIIQKILDAVREADDEQRPDKFFNLARKTIKKLSLPTKLKKKLSEIFKIRATPLKNAAPQRERQPRQFSSSSSSSHSRHARPAPMPRGREVAHNGVICGYCTRAGGNSPDCYTPHPEKKPGYIATPTPAGYYDLSLLFPLSFTFTCSLFTSYEL